MSAGVIRGYTGTRRLQFDWQFAMLRRDLERQAAEKPPTVLVTLGGAKGVDAAVGRWWGRYIVRAVEHDEPYPHITVFLPGAQWHDQMDFWWRDPDLHGKLPGLQIVHTDAHPTERNRMILGTERSMIDVLHAYPAQAHEVMRGSGTWQTIRLAAREQVPVQRLALVEGAEVVTA